MKIPFLLKKLDSTITSNDNLKNYTQFQLFITEFYQVLLLLKGR